MDKIDLILRRRRGTEVAYREVQVKFGKLYTCTQKWEQPLFSVSSWRFFTDQNLASLTDREGLFLAYVLAPDDGFEGDMFIFPINTFADIVRRSDWLKNGSYRVYISRSHGDKQRWYVRRAHGFKAVNEDTSIDVTSHYRDFACLEGSRA